MNVMVLTPDCVGSTLLQRAITIQMILSDFDKPVINLHELTNGITSYYSYELNRVILGKNRNSAININESGYNQTLQQIIELLDSADHYKTSRLAYYHILRRNDNLTDQKTFYQYISDNFFIISARRRNLFEYSLSWVLRNISKRLNVYNVDQKVYNFIDMYRDPIIVDPERLVNHLEEYKQYLNWAEMNFDINSNFYYEDHIQDLEKYILNLPIFNGKSKNTWNNTFGLTFDDYNKCHKSTSDIGSIALSSDNIKQLTFDKKENTTESLVDKITNNLPVSQQEFYFKNKEKYDKATMSINHMVKLGLLVTPLPIKKQTLREKKHIIKNFYECVDVYNEWISQNENLGYPYTENQFLLDVEKEDITWQDKV